MDLDSLRRLAQASQKRRKLEPKQTIHDATTAAVDDDEMEEGELPASPPSSSTVTTKPSPLPAWHPSVSATTVPPPSFPPVAVPSVLPLPSLPFSQQLQPRPLTAPRHLSPITNGSYQISDFNALIQDLLASGVDTPHLEALGCSPFIIDHVDHLLMQRYYETRSPGPLWIRTSTHASSKAKARETIPIPLPIPTTRKNPEPYDVDLLHSNKVVDVGTEKDEDDLIILPTPPLPPTQTPSTDLNQVEQARKQELKSRKLALDERNEATKRSFEDELNNLFSTSLVPTRKDGEDGHSRAETSSTSSSDDDDDDDVEIVASTLLRKEVSNLNEHQQNSSISDDRLHSLRTSLDHTEETSLTRPGQGPFDQQSSVPTSTPKLSSEANARAFVDDDSGPIVIDFSDDEDSALPVLVKTSVEKQLDSHIPTSSSSTFLPPSTSASSSTPTPSSSSTPSLLATAPASLVSTSSNSVSTTSTRTTSVKKPPRTRTKAEEELVRKEALILRDRLQIAMYEKKKALMLLKKNKSDDSKS